MVNPWIEKGLWKAVISNDRDPITKDFSGNGNDGTIHGATMVDGILGKAMQFDGVDNYIDCGHGASLDVTGAMTVEAWIKIDVVETTKRILMKGSSTTYTFFLAFDGTTAGKMRFRVFTTGSVTATSTTILSNATWYHIVGVYDLSNVYIYINGNLNDTQPQTGAIRTTTDNLVIGSDAAFIQVFTGAIDDVCIYNRALSGAEITSRYNAGMGKILNPATETGLVGYWRFETGLFQSGDGVMSKSDLTLISQGMGQFAINILNDGGAYNSLFNLGDNIDIWLDQGDGTLGTTKRLTGFIKRISYETHHVNNTITLRGFAYLDKTKRTVVHQLYVGPRTYQDIITNGTDGLLALYAPEVSGAGVQDAGISLGANETLKFDYITLWDALDRIRNLAGDWVFDIDPTKTLQFNPRGYTDTTKVLEDFDDTVFEYNDDKLVNRLYVFGGKDLTAISTAGWAGSASLNNADAPKAYDGNLAVAWDSGAAQDVGQWYKLDLGALTTIGKLIISSANFTTKYPRNYKVEVSKDNVYWTQIASVLGNTQTTQLIDFTQDAYRYIKITLTGADTNAWAISEIYLYSYYQLLSKLEDSASQGEHGVYEKPLRDLNIVSKKQSYARGKGQVDTYKDGILSCPAPIILSYFFDCSPNELISITVPGTPISQKFAVDSVRFYEDTIGSFREYITLRTVE